MTVHATPLSFQARTPAQLIATWVEIEAKQYLNISSPTRQSHPPQHTSPSYRHSPARLTQLCWLLRQDFANAWFQAPSPVQASATRKRNELAPRQGPASGESLLAWSVPSHRPWRSTREPETTASRSLPLRLFQTTGTRHSPRQRDQPHTGNHSHQWLTNTGANW
jgi:hypothetical protein